MKALGGFPFEKDTPYEQAFRTSTLSCHLVMTPGIYMLPSLILNTPHALLTVLVLLF